MSQFAYTLGNWLTMLIRYPLPDISSVANLQPSGRYAFHHQSANLCGIIICAVREPLPDFPLVANPQTSVGFSFRGPSANLCRIFLSWLIRKPPTDPDCTWQSAAVSIIGFFPGDHLRCVPFEPSPSAGWFICHNSLIPWEIG